MLTNLFIRLGWSRNDLKWPIAQIVSLAGLISSNTIDLPYWAAYLSVPLSPTSIHRILVAAAVVLWLAGRYNASPLPSARAMASGFIPNAPSTHN